MLRKFICCAIDPTMVRVLLILIFMNLKIVNGQVTVLTIAGFMPEDTVPRKTFLLTPFLTEAGDCFGLEWRLSRRDIVQYSVKLYANDSLVFSQKAVVGSLLPHKLLETIKLYPELLKIEVYDLVVKRPGQAEKLMKKTNIYYIE
jgi:hypothetical protein